MGTARWDAAKYGRNRGSAAGTVIGELHASGNHTTSTTASNLTDGAAGGGSAVTFPVGLVLHITCDELARVVLGGGTATATVGFLLQPDIAREIEITDSGTVSVIDEA
jgi:hypothetical protein